MATTSYASVIYYFFARGVPTNQCSKIFDHFTYSLKYTYIKKHSSFRFIALLFVPRSSEHKRSGAIGMLKAGVRVSRFTRYYNCHPSAIQHLRECYQATRTVKGRHRIGQLRMSTDIKTATYVDYNDDIYIDDIRSALLPKIVSMIRKYHNYKLQTTPWHREEEPLNHHETPGRQIKQSNQLSLPHQDDCNTRMDQGG